MKPPRFSFLFKLVDRKPEPCDLIEWAQQMQDESARRVGVTDIWPHVYVSTVFLGVSMGRGEAELFESRIFGGPFDTETVRCATWEQAEVLHEQMCELARSAPYIGPTNPRQRNDDESDDQRDD